MSSGLSLSNIKSSLLLLPPTLHLRLDLLEVGLELLHVRLLRGPADAEALLLVGLGNLNSGQVSYMRSDQIRISLPGPVSFRCRVTRGRRQPSLAVYPLWLFGLGWFGLVWLTMWKWT